MIESKETDTRITPAALWQVVQAFKGSRRVCDVCTTPDNPLRAELFFTERDDATSCRWATRLDEVHAITFWCNPPYSRGQVIRFAEVVVSWAELGLEVLLLTQADVSTDWYGFIRDNADVRCHLGKRVGFLKPDGRGGYEPLPGAKFGSQVAYFGPRRRRFARVFGEHGEILHGLGPKENETT